MIMQRWRSQQVDPTFSLVLRPLAIDYLHTFIELVA